MYRAIRTINGSEHVEFKHFDSVRDAYVWLVPSIQIQNIEQWNLKLLCVIIDELRTSLPYVHVGNNVLENETSLYIQRVSEQDNPLPIL
jgi:hypothetical protein